MFRILSASKDENIRKRCRRCNLQEQFGFVVKTLQAELKQAKPFTSLEEQTLLSVQRTADCLRREVQQALKPFNITMTQYNALRILRGAMPEGLACSEIGERLVSSDPDITRLLARLAKQGLIDRRRDLADRRVVLTAITPSGLTLLETLVPILDENIRTFLGHMPREKLDRLIELLGDLRAPYCAPCPEADGALSTAETQKQD